jgi:hypothetical protein
VAVHFVRHGWRLPFVDQRGKLSTGSFFIRSGFRSGDYFFYLESEPRDCGEWRPFPGMTILVTEPARAAKGLTGIDARPALRGFRIDTDLLQVLIDPGELVFEFGPDYLKDVAAALFVRNA